MPIGNNKPQSLKTLLSDLIESKGWSDKIDEGRLPDIWDEVVGEHIAKATKVRKFENGVLFVSTDSSTWRSEIKLMAPMLIEKLNEKIGKNLIKELKVN